MPLIEINGQRVFYAHERNFRARLSTEVINLYLCGLTHSGPSTTMVDVSTGHTLCTNCNKISKKSGLGCCENCNREYINLDKFEDEDIYEPNCPECE